MEGFLFFQAALVVAVMNIQIPLVLGGIVNIISKVPSEDGKSFSEQMLGPGLRLVSMYVAQVSSAVLYM